MSPDWSGILVILVVGSVAIGLVFYLIREVILWYFRINEIIDLLRKQIELQQVIANQDAARRLAEQQQMTQTLPSPPRNPLTGK